MSTNKHQIPPTRSERHQMTDRSSTSIPNLANRFRGLNITTKHTPTSSLASKIHGVPRNIPSISNRSPSTQNIESSLRSNHTTTSSVSSSLSIPTSTIPDEDASEAVNRLRQFFTMEPTTRGFTLISHRSAPNGFKVAVILSELNYPYETILLDFNKKDQKSAEFLSINPNGRVPALIDHTNPDRQVTIWESGSIILYLVEKKYKETGVCPSIWSSDLAEQAQIMSWLFFQTSGHSPMIGQALHFKYFHSVQVPSAIQRYTDEVRRVYGVLEVALSEKREALVRELDRENPNSSTAGLTPGSRPVYFDTPVWLVGDRITIADLCYATWNYVVDRIGIDLKSEFPEVYKWTKHMMLRPTVMRALQGN